MTRKKKIILDLNTQFARALELMEKTTQNVFVTGRAGTGKSTLLSHFRDTTKKNVVVLAPTGVAAVNIAGQTIHSFFHFKPDTTVQKVRRTKIAEADVATYQRLETIVIDEISMVRADLLDCIDVFLRLHGPRSGLPFGGVQMIFIGDLFQLPPVTTDEDAKIFAGHYASPYFFSAHVFGPDQQGLFGEKTDFTLECIELTKMYRQKDGDFIQLLNSIRSASASPAEFAALNSRVNPDFNPAPEEMYMYLTTTNAMADEVNARKLGQLETDNYFFKGQMGGKFDAKYLPTAPDLNIKIGAQVMMLNNDIGGRWINGTVGRVESVTDGVDGEPRAIAVLLESGVIELVTPHRWDIYNFSYDANSKRIESESVGTFTQYPLKLAWAVTIHKSQGKTFKRLVVDIGRGTFSAGQLYVALSRATTLEGLVLKRPLQKHHIWLDKKVVEYMDAKLGPRAVR
jgi:hypothetical protein